MPPSPGKALLPGLLAAFMVVTMALVVTPRATAAEKTSVSGDVSARLLYEPGVAGPPIALEITRGGVLRRFDSLEQLAPAPEFPYGVYAAEPLRVQDLDGDGEPEVVVELYWGGAHCCTRSVIARFDPAVSAHRLITHDWADATWRLEDLNGDGRTEFVSWDARWAYWSESYAWSPDPIQIWSLNGFELVDVTGDFPAEVRDDMAQQWTGFVRARSTGVGLRGSLAAYIADAYVLGDPDSAWLRAYRAYTRPGRARFFRALRSKLIALGYRAAGEYVPPLPPAGSGIYFTSPSGNLRCVISKGTRRASARCVSIRPRRGAVVAAGQRSSAGSVGSIPEGETLSYGRARARFGFVCRSRKVGMTCIDSRTRRGLRIAREGVVLLPRPAPVRPVARTEPRPQPTTPTPQCNPNYAGACIPNVPYDIDCGDVSATDFRSIGSDPYRFDGDGNGIACES